MIILDTNVLSALMREKADTQAIEWLDKQARTSIWTNSVTVLEIRFGLQILPSGKRRSVLMNAFETLLADKIGGRITSFDEVAVRHSAELMAWRHSNWSACGSEGYYDRWNDARLQCQPCDAEYSAFRRPFRTVC